MPPLLGEIVTTTQRQRGAKMPSSTVKQKKVMSAIAHGWKPHGSVASIPVKVAKEFHQADTGKYGHKPPSANAHGYGHGAAQRQGVLRSSGNAGAHRIGHRK